MIDKDGLCKVCYGIRDAVWQIAYAVGLVGYGALLYHFFVERGCQ